MPLYKKVLYKNTFLKWLGGGCQGTPFLLGLSQVSFVRLRYSSASALQPLWPWQDPPSCPYVALKEPSPDLRPLARSWPGLFHLSGGSKALGSTLTPDSFLTTWFSRGDSCSARQLSSLGAGGMKRFLLASAVWRQE